jgi:hypothetical protein
MNKKRLSEILSASEYIKEIKQAGSLEKSNE